METEQEASREEAQEDDLYVPLAFSASQLVGQAHRQLWQRPEGWGDTIDPKQVKKNGVAS